VAAAAAQPGGIALAAPLSEADRPEPEPSWEIGGVGGGVRLRPILRGTGMLVAVEDFDCSYDGEVVHLRAGQARLVPEHEIAARFPERFKPTDPDDDRTRELHLQMLRSRRGKREMGHEPAALGWRAMLLAAARHLSRRRSDP
jgi:hypothetical protein